MVAMTGKLILVGCGNMGHAMLVGWLGSGTLQAADATVVEPSEALRERAKALGVRVAAEAGELDEGESAELVVLAVKPQVMREVAAAYRSLAKRGATFLSIAAGTRMAVLEEVLGAGTPVMRCMPNTPAAIGKGMMALIDNGRVPAATSLFAEALLAANGRVARLGDEDMMDAVTAVSGSGPAYVFHFIECLRDAAIEAGLPRTDAGLFAMQTVYGAACLAAESGEEPGRLREQVTSPKGTTAAALAVLMGEERMGRLVGEAVAAAKARSIELG
jgi:pyrroline-5-carboxylate reductase